MLSNILLVFATEEEKASLDKVPGVTKIGTAYRWNLTDLNVLVTGVGGMATAWALKRWLYENQKPGLAVNAGIAGSFAEKFDVGDVVIPVSDCFADLGMEINGRFVSLGEAGLINPSEYPFENELIIADNIYVRKALSVLPVASGATVNTASGTTGSINRLKERFNPDIETMEGATFFYICAVEKIPFLGIRAISNKVEPGTRKTWDIALALDNLAVKLNEVLMLFV